MARDSSVGRERVLVVQGGMHSMENAAQSQPSDSIDINQQILEVSTEYTNMFPYIPLYIIRSQIVNLEVDFIYGIK